jgi:tetratricopeptide (TPR) repeat protein
MGDHPAAAVNQALAALQRGEPQRAERLLQDALKTSPKELDALITLGAIYGQQGRFQDAAAQFERAAQAHPDSADAHYNLGLALAHLGSRERALDGYRAALVANPRHLNAHNNLAAELMMLERWDEAQTCLTRALAIAPGNPQLLSKLGVALKESGRLDEAIDTLREAARIQPNDPAIRANLGLALRHAHRLDDAIASFRQALAFDPRFAGHHNHLGLALSEVGQLDAAVESLRRALTLDPNSAEFRENLGLILLLKGEFREGWAQYDSRNKVRRSEAQRSTIDAPFWKGEPLAGMRILVRAEQGLGDTLQFVRYLPMLVDAGAAVTFEVQPKLAPILKPFSKSIAIVPGCDARDTLDFQSNLLSLPGGFGTDLSNIPCNVPYLSADDSLVSHWRGIIGADGFKVGICWQGNPNYKGDRVRSIPLREFGPLADIPGIRLISLQKRPGDEQIASVPFADRIEVLGDNFDERGGAFMDSAAVMMSLDLVVTSDTSIAHLAGALARPLYVALPLVPDWRWLIDRDDSPWYPTARLFRQERARDWAGVFARIAAEVRGAGHG